MGVYRRRGSPHWVYDVTVQGRRFRGSTETADHDLAKAVEARVRREALTRAVLGQRPTCTLAEALSRYWRERAEGSRSAANVWYQSRNLVALLGGETALDRLTDADLARAVAQLRGRRVGKRTGRRLGPASVNRHLELLRRVLIRARDAWGLAVAPLAFKAHRLREPAPRARYLTPAEADRLIAAAAPHLRPAIRISLLTGLRLANVLRLDWREVDLQARVLTVAVKSAAPGGKPHLLPLAPALVAELANLGPRPEGPVFTRPGTGRWKGRAVPIRSWRTAWEGARARAGLPEARWHDLRHTTASWLLQSGADLATVRDVLGHESIATTTRYAHLETEAKARALARLAPHWRRSGAAESAQPADREEESA